jgi:hypothetical protein
MIFPGYWRIRALAADDWRMSTTTPVWVPLVTTVVGLVAGIGTAMATAILTQQRTDRREDIRWRRERCDRQEEWARTDKQRWLIETQQAYARLIGALRDWENMLRFAVKARGYEVERVRRDDAENAVFDKVFGRTEVEIDTAELDRKYRTAWEALNLVQFIAPESTGELAERALWSRLALNQARTGRHCLHGRRAAEMVPCRR